MKRILWLVVVLFVASIGAGCGGSNQAVELATKTIPAPKEKGKPMRIELKKPN